MKTLSSSIFLLVVGVLLVICSSTAIFFISAQGSSSSQQGSGNGGFSGSSDTSSDQSLASLSGSSENEFTLPVPTEPDDERLLLSLDANNSLQVYNLSLGANQYICSDLLDEETAKIACRSMGMDATAVAVSIVPNSIGLTPGAYVSDFQCAVGTIEIINKPGQCSWGYQQACKTEHRVKVSCGKITTGFTFQLADNNMLFATKVSDDSVGTVCDDQMTDVTAKAICSTMNAAPQNAVQWWTVPNYRTDPVVLSAVSCPDVPITDFATQCEYRLSSTCTNLEAVAIYCNSTQIPQVPLNVHFAIDPARGDLLVASPLGAASASVALRKLPSKRTAEVICSWLGYTDLTQAVPTQMSVDTHFAFFDSLDCPLGARNLQACTYVLGRAQSTISTVAAGGVICGGPKVSYDLRVAPSGLVQLASPGSNNYVGTMCGAGGVATKTIQGICNIALNGVGAPYNNVYGWNLGGTTQATVLADNVRCNATASAFSDCAFDTNTYCSHEQDLAVVCDTTQPNLFKFSMTNDLYARVQPPGASQALGICADFIDQVTATKICAFNGLPTGMVNTDYGPITGALGLNYLKCPATANNIFDCLFSQAGDCGNTLKISCQVAPTTPVPPAPPTRAPPPPPPTRPPNTPAPPITPSPPGPQPTPQPTTPAPQQTPSPGGATMTAQPTNANTPSPASSTTPAPPTKTYPKNSVTFRFNNGMSSGFTQTAFINTLAQLLNVSSGAVQFDDMNATAVTVTFTGVSGDASFSTAVGWTDSNSIPIQLKNYGVSGASDANNNASPPNSAPPSPPSSGGGGNGGAIAGGVIGGIVGIALIGFLVYKFTASPARAAMDDQGRNVQFSQEGSDYVAHTEV